ncbi:MAG: aldo/keto reductase, partial [Chloroflexi bacterium]|nr:aldo/keto reductase [Chloroflexota bacterium]
DGTYTEDTVFDDSDHRSHRRREWLTNGLKKLATLDFLMENLDATIGQTAIKFGLSGSGVASILPNFTNLTQLEELAATSDTEDIPEDFLTRIHELFDSNFGLPVEEEAPVGD